MRVSFHLKECQLLWRYDLPSSPTLRLFSIVLVQCRDRRYRVKPVREDKYSSDAIALRDEGIPEENNICGHHCYLAPQCNNTICRSLSVHTSLVLLDKISRRNEWSMPERKPHHYTYLCLFWYGHSLRLDDGYSSLVYRSQDAIELSDQNHDHCCPSFGFYVSSSHHVRNVSNDDVQALRLQLWSECHTPSTWLVRKIFFTTTSTFSFGYALKRDWALVRLVL